MGKTMKKVFSMFLVLCMIFGLTACGGNKNTSTNGTDTTKTTDTASTDTASTDSATTTDSATPAIDTSEHVVIKFVVLGNKPTNGHLEAMLEQLNKKLTEKVNAELEPYYVEWTDWQTQYNLLLASGDTSIDLIGTATDWLDAWPNAKKGAFLELTDDMLKTYAPQTYASVTQDHWNMCKYNSKIYLMPEDNYAQWTNHGFMYRGDWAKEFGLTNGVNSFAELGQYFAGIKANKPDVIPWDAAASGQAFGSQLAGGYFESNTNTLFMDGLDVPIFYGASKDDMFTLASPYMEGQEYIDFAKLMKEWGDAGYWREDVLNYTGDTREELYAGQTGADQHHTQTYYTTVRPQMDSKQPGSDVQFFSFSEPSKNLMKLVITHGATAISSSSKHPERALMVYDLLRNDQEIYRLYNYGIEGTDYVINSEGKLDRPEGYDASKDSLDTNFWYGRNDKLELDNATWYTGKKEIFANYDSYAIDYPYSQLVYETDDIAPYLANMSDVFASYSTSIAFGKAGDPEQAVADFRAAMKAAGYDEVYKALQDQLTQYKAYLGK
jgi:putative aldouronate transport system substrate-binding protein